MQMVKKAINKSMEKAMEKSIRRFLVRGVTWRVGDSLLSTPFFHGLSRLFPKSHVTLLVEDELAGLFEHNSDIDEILKFNYRAMSTFEKLRYARQFRGKFDAYITLNRSFESAFYGLIGKIPKRIGYASEGRRMILTDALKEEKKDLRSRTIHYVDYYLGLLSPFIKDPAKVFGSERPKLRLGAGVLERWKPYLRKIRKRKLMAFAPFSQYGEARSGTNEFWRKLLERALRKTSVLGLGSPPELQRIRGLRSSLPPSLRSKLHLPPRPTEILDAAALIAGADIFLGVDSGLYHVAQALGRPGTVLFGSTSPLLAGPRATKMRLETLNLACAPCFERTCPLGTTACINNMLPGKILGV